MNGIPAVVVCPVYVPSSDTFTIDVKTVKTLALGTYPVSIVVHLGSDVIGSAATSVSIKS